MPQQPVAAFKRATMLVLIPTLFREGKIRKETEHSLFPYWEEVFLLWVVGHGRGRHQGNEEQRTGRICHTRAPR